MLLPHNNISAERYNHSQLYIYQNLSPSYRTINIVVSYRDRGFYPDSVAYCNSEDVHISQVLS